MKATGSDQDSIQPADTFVIRLWREWSLEAPRWRGRVLNVQTGKSAVFQDKEELLVFLRIVDQIENSTTIEPPQE